jgi:hypothetical protein
VKADPAETRCGDAVDVKRAADLHAQGWTLRADNAGSELLIFVAISQVSDRTIAKPKRPLPALIGRRDSS